MTATNTLAYGNPQILRMNMLELATLVCLNEFVATIVEVHGPQYLRAPNNSDIARLLALGICILAIVKLQ